MVTGSVASSFHGEPRATHDVDFVVALSADAVLRLRELFSEPEYYFDPDAAIAAVRSGGMFNILSVETGDKIDCWILTDSRFDRARFARRSTVYLLGTAVVMQSPEDTLVSKLLWAKESGGSEKQIGDARAIIENQTGDLDRAYIEGWIESLELENEWRQCLQR